MLSSDKNDEWGKSSTGRYEISMSIKVAQLMTK
jgi:hypothetical protein